MTDSVSAADLPVVDSVEVEQLVVADSEDPCPSSSAFPPSDRYVHTAAAAASVCSKFCLIVRSFFTPCFSLCSYVFDALKVKTFQGYFLLFITGGGVMGVISLTYLFFRPYSFAGRGYYEYSVPAPSYLEWEASDKPVANASNLHTHMSSNGITGEYIRVLNKFHTSYSESDFLSSDQGTYRNCSVRHRPEEYFKLLKHWITFAASHKITWWISFETLLGQKYYGNVLHWSQGLNVEIMFVDYWKLQVNQNARGHLVEGINLVTRPGVSYGVPCFYKPCMPVMRLNCEGQMVEEEMDLCSFSVQYARLFSGNDSFNENIPVIDINYVQLTEYDGRLWFYSEAIATKYEHHEPAHFPYGFIAPLKECHFMGLSVPCPNNVEKYLLLSETNAGIYANVDSFDTLLEKKAKHCPNSFI